MSKNTALTVLGCDNQLTDEGLNALFGTLHANAGSKVMGFGGNSSTKGCDRTIQIKAGWYISDVFMKRLATQQVARTGGCLG